MDPRAVLFLLMALIGSIVLLGYLTSLGKFEDLEVKWRERQRLRGYETGYEPNRHKRHQVPPKPQILNEDSPQWEQYVKSLKKD
jgi:hypothetical protein